MVVEDGTGKTDANSYVDIAYADDYLTSHGVTSFTDLEEEKQEVLLVKASDYINSVYDWNGIKKTKEQSLNFPRTELYDKDGYEVEGVPNAIKQAVCEAVIVLSGDTELFQTVSENGAVTSEKIGNLAFTYDVSQKIKDSTLYESINSRLRGLYRDSSKKKIYSGKVLRKL